MTVCMYLVILLKPRYGSVYKLDYMYIYPIEGPPAGGAEFIFFFGYVNSRYRLIQMSAISGNT